MNQVQHLLEALPAGNIQALSRCISLVENKVAGYEDLLCNLPLSHQPVIGITAHPVPAKARSPMD